MKSLPNLILLLFIYPSMTFSAPLEIGDNLLPLSLPDQYGNLHNLSDAHTILFAPDKETGELAHEQLQHENKTDMMAKGFWFISDISRMPGFVTRFFALPAMRKYPYFVLLGYKEAQTAWLPSKEGALTLMQIRSGKVIAIEYIDTQEGVSQRLHN
ncbi:MAG: hypothetical protein P8179_14385 [Candidatus Thiodiazotropha sp.]|jgi:hypothetical protein